MAQNRRLILLVLNICLALLPLNNSFALRNNQIDQSDESTLKALFMFNFTKHIEWPAQRLTDKRFTIVFYGNSDVAPKLNELLKNRKIFDLPVEILTTTNRNVIKGSTMVFIPKGKIRDFLEHADDTQNDGILYITEENRMPTRGSCINLIKKEDKMTFELNEMILKKQGLKVSNQLHELAAAIK